MTFETNFEKICRTCLSESTTMKSVFSIDDSVGESVRLYEMLTSCTSVQVFENDGLPSQVCLQCVHYITRAFYFKQLCERSDQTLREIFIRQLKPIVMGAEMIQPETQPLIVNLTQSGVQDANSSYIKTVPIEKNERNVTPVEVVETANEMSVTPKILDSSPCDFDSSFISDEVEQDLPLESKTPNQALVKSEIYQLKQNVAVKLFEKVEMVDVIEYKKNEDEYQYDQDVPEADEDCPEPVLSEIPDSDTSTLNADIKVCSFAKEVEEEDETKQPIFPCEKCTQCFTQESDLQVHEKTHKKSEDKRHICKVCQMVFASASTLCRHVKSHGGAKRHLCTECGKGFSRSDDLTRHIRTHTGERPFSCKLCSKSFAQSFRLLEHIRAHKGEKSFVCPTCGKAFCRYTSFRVHMKIHTGVKTHTCNLCGKKLCGSGSLAIHMKTHTGLKDHICPYCGKGFTTPSNLNIHKRTHTGERPYVCNTCGKGFPDPSRLTVHSRCHTGEKPYVCKVCNRGCVSSSQLKKHMRIHTGEKPYSCTLCPKTFPRSEDLKIHIKTHLGDRSHICGFCNKGFYQTSTLKVHMRIHTGEKPYECKYCHEAFSQTGPLSNHIKKYHNKVAKVTTTSTNA